MLHNLTQDMHSILDDERKALLAARYEALVPLESAKADLLTQLAQTTSSKEELASIKKKMDENQSLLAAAIAGTQAARERFDALRNVRRGLSVYDKSGTLAMVPSQQNAVERKA
jgi:flagellar biosynthesis/type III secretory pathway chaperone